MTKEEKAKELGQKYFPDSANIWARGNIESHAVESACMEMAAFVEQQFEANRLKACDSQTKEEAEREWNFVEHMIKEEHRQPTYSDAIEYGRKLMKEEIIAELEAELKKRKEEQP